MVSNAEEIVSREVRREELARLVGERGFVRVADASARLGVSDVTIRGDLSALAAAGSVVRVHGGAMPAADRESPLEASLTTDAAEKAAIGRAAALVERHDLRDLVIVTSGLTVALALEPALPRFTVVVTGGTLRPLQHSLVNPFAAPMLDALRLDIAFIGCNGIHPVDGVTNVNLPEAEIKTRVLRASRRHVLVADATKLGRTEVAVIGAIADFDVLITAGSAPAALLDELRAGGLAVEPAYRVDG